MKNINSPEQQPSKERQKVEARLSKKIKLLKGLQRTVFGATFTMGVATGVIDGTAIGEHRSQVSAALVTVPAVTLSAAGAELDRRKTYRSCEKLIISYAARSGDASDRFSHTELRLVDEELQADRTYDPDASAGERFEGSLVYLGEFRQGAISALNYLGSYTAAAIHSEIVPLTPTSSFLVQGLGVVAAVGGGIMQVLEDKSSTEHLKSYVIQLDNIDGGLSFGGPELPPA